MTSKRRMTASLIALLIASAVAAGGATVGAKPSEQSQVPVPPCVPDLGGGSPVEALLGSVLGTGLQGQPPTDVHPVGPECADLDVPSDGLLIDRLRISTGGSKDK